MYIGRLVPTEIPKSPLEPSFQFTLNLYCLDRIVRPFCYLLGVRTTGEVRLLRAQSCKILLKYTSL